MIKNTIYTFKTCYWVFVAHTWKFYFYGENWKNIKFSTLKIERLEFENNRGAAREKIRVPDGIWNHVGSNTIWNSDFLQVDVLYDSLMSYNILFI